MMTVSYPIDLAYSIACGAVLTGFCVPFSNTSTPTFLPTTLSCSIAAGRYTSHPTSRGFLPPFFNSNASLPQSVVLPAPCKPHIIITVGGLGATVSFALDGPISSISSSFTIFITCWAGFKLSKIF